MPAHATTQAPPEAATTAFIVRVPEAEACVGALRQRYEPSARLGVPAHITVLYPFMPPPRVGAFPAFAPFRGEPAQIVAHLTVANGDANDAAITAAELARTMQAHGPIEAVCSHVTLLENAAGVWRERHVFALPR